MDALPFTSATQESYTSWFCVYVSRVPRGPGRGFEPTLAVLGEPDECPQRPFLSPGGCSVVFRYKMAPHAEVLVASGSKTDRRESCGRMRNKRLDILRSIAVLTVIVHHGGVSPFFTRVGWIGVDLFFVLSGFLISGLLFSEHKKRKSIDLKRFFIRRGLKIYPAFYVFLILTGAISYFVVRTHSSAAEYLAEVFFVQNYWHGAWDHTWTLAVEEHFYIFLPLLLLLLTKLSTDRGNPFRSLPSLFVGVAVLCMALRAVSVYFGIPNYHMAYTASHDRMDALFFGVLIGYYYHFRPHVLEELVRPTVNRVAIGLCSGALISTAYFFSRESRVFSMFGYTCVYLGCGGALLLGLYVRGILRGGTAKVMEMIGTAAAAVGVYSYSIYLWHGPTNAWFPGLVRRALHISLGTNQRFAIYFAGSLTIGIAMSKLIEYPILRVRDRLFPVGQIVAVGPSDTGETDASTEAAVPDVSPTV
jgi:peptidoglycan/LPS O-acetylase OafA/YrhL